MKTKKAMNKSNLKFQGIDAYHAQFPKITQKTLQQLRRAIRQAAPDASEEISYGMPAFRQNKVLVYYAANKNHIGFYPTPNPIKMFNRELAKYKTSKGAVQFPNDKPLPLGLVKKIVKFRVKEDMTGAKPKDKKEAGANGVSADIRAYNGKLPKADQAIGRLLAQEISDGLPEAENKIWHGHPVWFLDGNPVAGYGKLKDCMRLLFWSGQSFDEPGLQKEGSFKAAEKRYASVDEVNTKDLKRWLKKARDIQWDYKNIVKRKGVLVRLK
jgi:uncharacterized protein YdhG (YjbR/CyaY superfamily)